MTEQRHATPHDPADIVMPTLKGGLTEAKITQWCKGIGDSVKPGDIIFRAATDPNSAPVDVTSLRGGTLKEILVSTGESAHAGQACAKLG